MMKWILTKKKKKIKIKATEIFSKNLEFNLGKQVIIVYPEDLIDELLLNKINESLNQLIKQIIEHLSTDEEGEENTTLLLGELAKQRSIYQIYDEKLSKAAIMKYMKKIRLLAFELKKKLQTYKKEPIKSKGR